MKPQSSIAQFKTVIIIAILLVVSGCETMPTIDEPRVSLASISLLEQNVFSPKFKIGLRISNPNSFSLPVQGMSYAISLQGKEIFQGVSNNIAPIPAYGESLVYVELGANILKAGSLLKDLLVTPQTALNYSLHGKLDLQGLWPTINISESGLVPLQ